MQDAEISRLREELGAARAKLSSWEESMIQVENSEVDPAHTLLIIMFLFIYKLQDENWNVIRISFLNAVI